MGHQWRHLIALPIDLPALDGWAYRARWARGTAITVRTLLTPFPRHRHQLPTLAGAIARIITSRNEGTAVQRDDVECSIALTSLESAAHVGRATIASVLTVYAGARGFVAVRNRVHIASFGPRSKTVRHLALGPAGSEGV